MKKFLSAIILMAALCAGVSAQNRYLVVASGDSESWYYVENVDSITFLDASDVEVDADAVIDMNICLPYDASNYGTVTFNLPLKQIQGIFGYETAGELAAAIKNNTVKFYFYNYTAKDIYSVDHSSGTANSGGCWFDANGDVCSWGANSVLFIEPALTSSKATFTLGQYPSHAEDGGEYHLMMGLQDGETFVAFNLHITIGEVQQEALTYDVYFEQDPTGGSERIISLNDEEIAAAFGMTAAEVANAIGNGSIILYPVDADGNVDKSEELLCLDGYWFNSEGTVCAEDDEDATLYIMPTFEGTDLIMTQAPYATTIEDEYTIKVALSNDNTDVVLTLNVTVVEEGFVPTGFTNDGENNIVIHMDINTNYASMAVTIDADKVLADLEYESLDELVDDLELINLNADGSTGNNTANGGGAWFDADGNTIAWGASARVYAEPSFSSSALKMNVGMYPSGINPGDVYYISQKLTAGGKESIVKYEIHMK